MDTDRDTELAALQRAEQRAWDAALGARCYDAAAWDAWIAARDDLDELLARRDG